MSLVRVVAIALLFSPLFGFAQDRQVDRTSPSIAASSRTASTNLLESWNFSPELSADVKPPLDSLSQKDSQQIVEQLNDANHHILPPTPNRTREFISTENSLWPDSTCYTIRSYVVARDAAGSDSTHPVSYSTCQPGSRYGLKTTELKQNSPDR